MAEAPLIDIESVTKSHINPAYCSNIISLIDISELIQTATAASKTANGKINFGKEEDPTMEGLRSYRSVVGKSLGKYVDHAKMYEDIFTANRMAILYSEDIGMKPYDWLDQQTITLPVGSKKKVYFSIIYRNAHRLDENLPETGKRWVKKFIEALYTTLSASLGEEDKTGDAKRIMALIKPSLPITPVVSGDSQMPAGLANMAQTLQSTLSTLISSAGQAQAQGGNSQIPDMSGLQGMLGSLLGGLGSGQVPAGNPLPAIDTTIPPPPSTQ